jgi:hypothetical protein
MQSNKLILAMQDGSVFLKAKIIKTAVKNQFVSVFV